MSLIEEVGDQYVTEMCRGAWFYYNDRLLVLNSANLRLVQCEDAATRESVFVPAEFFTGWKVFAGAPSGYRRLDSLTVAYASRTNSTRRGLRSESVRLEYSPATMLLSRLRSNSAPSTTNEAKMAAYIRPVWDNLEESLPRLLSGQQLSIVLNENVVIEAAVGQRADAWYSILYKQAVIGKLNRHGRVTWNDPENSVIIPSLQAA